MNVARADRPLVSVIVPVYNQGEYLSRALTSLESQTLRDWECVIVNDGATDNTDEVARKFLSKDARFRYVTQKNKGLAGARNAGLDHALGKYIQFLDADDAIAPEKLALQTELLKSARGLGISVSDYTVFYGRRRAFFRITPRIISTPPLYDILMHWSTQISIPVHCYLFDARIFNHGLRFNETVKIAEDWDCWLRLFQLSVEVFYISKRLAIYNKHPATITTSPWNQRDVFIEIARRHQTVLDRSDPRFDWFEKKIRILQLTYGPGRQYIRYLFYLYAIFRRDILGFLKIRKEMPTYG